MEQNAFLKKNRSSESIIREREKKNNEQESESPEHKTESKYNKEAFGLHNSFDDLSVKADKDGMFSIEVTSQKEYHSPTLDISRKQLRNSRTKKFYGHFGDLYVNSASPKNSAFAYRARKNLSENRILSEFRNTTEKRLSLRQRETTPLLTIGSDRKRLSELRSKTEKTDTEKEETSALEQKLIKSADYENRFLRKLRIFRQKPLSASTLSDDRTFAPHPEISEITDGDPDEQTQDQNTENNNKE